MGRICTKLPRSSTKIKLLGSKINLKLILIPLSLAHGVLPSKLKLKKNKKNVLEVFRKLECLIKVSGNK